MAGRWEFPGGKLEPSETPRTGLARELKEELGIDTADARPLIEFTHIYPERQVHLHVWRVIEYRGTPLGLDGQPLSWVEPTRLDDRDLLEADAPIATAIRLPSLYSMIGLGSGPAESLEQLERVLEAEISLVQLCLSEIPAAQRLDFAATANRLCRASMARLLIEGDPRETLALASRLDVAGIHVPSAFIGELGSSRPSTDLMIAASCCDAIELRAAVRANVDFCVLGPVRGWGAFRRLVRDVAVPVYAFGELTATDCETAWLAGGQGVAGGLIPLTV